jgi:hypothetical protein
MYQKDKWTKLCSAVSEIGAQWIEKFVYMFVSLPRVVILKTEFSLNFIHSSACNSMNVKPVWIVKSRLIIFTKNYSVFIV